MGPATIRRMEIESQMAEFFASLERLLAKMDTLIAKMATDPRR